MSEEIRPHILIVDDNAILLRNVKSVLETKYSVAVAASGLQAFVAMRRQRPDLILLDYEMPGMDGEEVMRKIQTEEDWKHIPVIFLTSAADKDVVTSLLSYRPAGYLLKPTERDTLLDTVKKHLGY